MAQGGNMLKSVLKNRQRIRGDDITDIHTKEGRMYEKTGTCLKIYVFVCNIEFLAQFLISQP